MKKDKSVKKSKKAKKGFFRRKTVIFALVLLLVVCLSTYFFTSCKNENVGPEPDYESIHEQASTMLATPTDGSLPSEHDAKNNAYYAVYAMNELTSFTSQSSGKTVTKVAMVEVEQLIKGNRVVNGDEIYKENVSFSSFKGVGVRTFIKGNNYVVHNANGVKSIDDTTWEDTASRISKEDFLNKFGFVPNSITGYVLSDETILSAEFLGEENGVYSFKYDLDPVKSTGKLLLEMRTMAGSKSSPVFEKASITIRMNANWQVTEVVTSSVYEVDLLGGVTCTESVTEKFSNYNQGVPVPNSEFYNSYVDAEITEPLPEKLTATDYLTEAFGDYVSGAKPLKAQIQINNAEQNLSASADAEVSLNLEDIKNTKVKLNLNALSFGELNLENVFVALDDGNLYLKVGDLKVKTNTEEITGILNKISSLSETNLTSSLGALGSINLEGLDFTSLISGATMEEFENYVDVSLPLSLGDLKINANLIINKGEKNTLSKITAKLGALDVTVTLSDSITISESYEGYNSVAHLLDFIDEDGNVKADVSLGEINLKLNFNLKTLELDAYASNLVLDGLSLGEVKVKLKDNVIYADALGLKVKLALSDIETLLNKITTITGTQISMPGFSSLSDVNALELISSVINSLEITENEGELNLSARLLGYDLSAILSITENGYEMKGVTLNANQTQILVNVIDQEIPAIDGDLSNYNDIITLLDIVDENGKINFTVNAFDMDIDVCFNLTNLTLLAKTELFGETLYAKLVENKVYLSYKGLNVYADLNDIDLVLDKLAPIVGEIVLPDFSDITLESILSSLTVTDSDVITIALDINDIALSVILDKANGLTLSSVNATLGETQILVTPSAKADYSGMTADKYYNAISLLDVISNDGKISLQAEAFGATVYITIDLVNGEILAKLEDLEILVDLEENMLYARYPGVNAKLNLDKINYVINELRPLLTKFISEEELNSINLDSFNSLSIEDIISSITVFESQNDLTINLKIGDVNANVVLSTNYNELRVSGGTISMKDLEIPFATTSNSLDFTFDKTIEYVDLASVIESLAPALRNILTLDNLYASMTAKIVMGNQVLELTECEILISNIYSAPRVRINLTLKITTNNQDGTTKTSEHKITLVYLDPSLVGEGEINTYFTYDDTSNKEVLEGTFTTVNFNETLDILKEIYANMPELRDALKPILVPDENEMPVFPEISIEFNKLLNLVSFANGTILADINGNTLLSDLNSSIVLNVFAKDGMLCLDASDLKLRDSSISLFASVGEAPNGIITEDKFTFTPSSNAMNFSSINELLKALEKTSEKRYFELTADVDGKALGVPINDAIKIKFSLAIIDGKTYFTATIERQFIHLVIMPMWKDAGGTATIYFDADAKKIYVHHNYKSTLFSSKKTDLYVKYTVEQFSADTLNIIFDILRISDELRNEITKDKGEQKANTATIENTLKKYSYSENKRQFDITLDLAPLTSYIQTTTIAIKHDSDFNLTGLNANASMFSLINLSLNASLATKNSEKEENDAINKTISEIKNQASNSKYN